MSEAELKEAIVNAAVRFHKETYQSGSMSAMYARDALFVAVRELLKCQGVNDPAVKGADLLTRAGLLEAAENGKDLGTCDED